MVEKVQYKYPKGSFHIEGWKYPGYYTAGEIVKKIAENCLDLDLKNFARICALFGQQPTFEVRPMKTAKNKDSA